MSAGIAPHPDTTTGPGPGQGQGHRWLRVCMNDLKRFTPNQALRCSDEASIMQVL